MNLAVVTAALALFTFGPADELERRLGELSAPRGEVRHDAERWLAANVTERDGGTLAAAALSGDAEVRRRIGRILGASRGGLGMASVFLAQADPVLSSVGERAIRTRLARWNPRAGERGLSGSHLRESLDRTAQRSWPETIRLRVDGTLEEACALLTRRGRLPLGIAVEA